VAVSAASTSVRSASVAVPAVRVAGGGGGGGAAGGEAVTTLDRTTLLRASVHCKR
jgi:hypothetical protein